MTKTAAIRAFHLLSFIAGAVLFVYVIKQTGITELKHHIGMLGLTGTLAIIGLSAVRNCMRAGSWYYSIEPQERGVTFWALMNTMLAGEAIKYLTATGPLVSEPAKAAMVRREVPLLQGLSSVVVENLVYYLTVFIFMFAGLPALLWLAEVPGDVKLAGLVLVAAIALSIVVVFIAIRLKSFILARSFDQIARRRRFSRVAPLASNVRRIEENLYSFYEHRRRAFFVIFALNMASHLINIVEVWVILLLLDLPATMLNGFIIEAITKVINFVFFFVPTRAGVYESGNALLLQALGMSASAGVALAIIRKLRAFIWVAYGLVIIGILAARRERTE